MNSFGPWRMLLLSLIPVSLLVGWAVVTGHFVFNRPPSARYPIHGIDLSHHNGPIDWKAVSEDGIDFAFLKATEGSDFQDSMFAQNFNAARAYGIKVGAYHFFSTLSSGEEQASNFIDTVPRLEGMLPPVIDVEFSRNRSAMSDEKFHLEFAVLFSTLQNHYGVTPVVYTTQEFHEDYLSETKIARLWARSLLGKPYPLAKDWIFWQYSNLGRVAGISSPVDLNVFRGSAGELSLLGKNEFQTTLLQFDQHPARSSP